MPNLYLLSPPKISNPQTFTTTLNALLTTKTITYFQLRIKPTSLETIKIAIKAIAPICQTYNTSLILNDHPLKGHNLHVGKDDLSVQQARQKLGDNVIIGASCYDSIALAEAAVQQGASYVAFGAFYETSTKEAATRATPELLRQWKRRSEVPCVAIGGITAESVAPIVQAGADMVAVCGAVWHHPKGPVYAVQELHEAIEEATP